jgi:hypothetical protein
MAATPAVAAEITETFSAPLPATWQRYAPLAAFGVPSQATVQDGVLTLSHPASPVPQIAPAVIGIGPTDINWSDFEMSVEFTGWAAGDKVNCSILLSARTSLGGDGLASGYSLSITPTAEPALANTGYLPTAGLSLESVVGGRSIGSLAGTDIPTLDPVKWYRTVFRGTRSDTETSVIRLYAELYEAGGSEPIAIIFGRVPAAHFSGSLSLAAVDRAALAGIGNNGVTVKFDNFKASGTPVTPVAEPSLTVANAVMLSWPASTIGWTLESAANADGPWTSSAAAHRIIDGDQNRITTESSGAARFFRLRKP